MSRRNKPVVEAQPAVDVPKPPTPQDHIAYIRLRLATVYNHIGLEANAPALLALDPQERKTFQQERLGESLDSLLQLEIALKGFHSHGE